MLTDKEIDAEQAAFEKWMSDDGKLPRAVEKKKDGGYKLYQTASYWMVWKARAQQVAEVQTEKPFAYFFQPSSFGPFAECDPWQTGCFPAYRAPQAGAGQAVAVPDGWKLVPIDPNIKMIAALGWEGDEDMAIGHALISEGFIKDYHAMLAAAPLPPQSATQAEDAK